MGKFLETVGAIGALLLLSAFFGGLFGAFAAGIYWTARLLGVPW